MAVKKKKVEKIEEKRKGFFPSLRTPSFFIQTIVFSGNPLAALCFFSPDDNLVKFDICPR